jgi:hypothetical protein
MDRIDPRHRTGFRFIGGACPLSEAAHYLPQPCEQTLPSTQARQQAVEELVLPECPVCAVQAHGCDAHAPASRPRTLVVNWVTSMNVAAWGGNMGRAGCRQFIHTAV